MRRYLWSVAAAAGTVACASRVATAQHAAGAAPSGAGSAAAPAHRGWSGRGAPGSPPGGVAVPAADGRGGAIGVDRGWSGHPRGRGIGHGAFRPGGGGHRDHRAPLLLWPYGWPYSVYGVAYGLGVAVNAPTVDAPAPPAAEPLVVGGGGPATVERRVGRTRVIDVGSGPTVGDSGGLRIIALGDSLLRLTWAGAAGEVSFLTADASRRPVTVQTTRRAPHAAVLPRDAEVAYAGVTVVGADGVATTRLVPVARPR